MDVYDLPRQTWILGQKQRYELEAVDTRLGSSLSALTATLQIRDSAGSATLAATAMTIDTTITTRPIAWYLITTGSGMNITAAGTYRVVVTLTYPNSEVRIRQGELEIKTLPA
jgi:hypothetical protein